MIRPGRGYAAGDKPAGKLNVPEKVGTVTASKQRGTAWETAVVRYFTERGWLGIERRTLAGKNDKGDFSGFRDWTFEAKAERAISLAQYMAEAEVEAANAGTKWYAAIVKRRQKGTREAYVVMPLHIFEDVLTALDFSGYRDRG